MLYKGEGVERSEEKAFHWWKKAAEQGFVLAQSRIGYCYIKGVGVKVDAKMAYLWWDRAAANGNEVARRNLEILCGDQPEVCKNTESEAVKPVSDPTLSQE